MRLKETLELTSGVTLFESNNQKEPNMKRAVGLKQPEQEKKEVYTIAKRSKPFTKMALDSQSPRMTREDYFKIAENRGLATMREELGSLMTTKDNEISLQTGSVFASSKVGASFQVGLPSKKIANLNLVSISVNQNESSDDIDTIRSRKHFNKRH